MTSRFSFFTILAFISLFISSCIFGSLDYISYKDPDFHNRSIRKVCIYAQIENIVIRRNIEEAIVEELESQNVHAISSLEILIPTREWTQEGIHKQMTTNHFDSFLRFELSDFEDITRSEPGYSTAINVANIACNLANTNNSYFTATLASAVPAHSYQQTLVNGIVNVIDIKSNNTIWHQTISQENGEGYDQQSFKDFGFLTDIADAIIDGLQKDRLIR